MSQQCMMKNLRKTLKLINNLKEKNNYYISHKKETLKNCDNIYEISNKKLIKYNFN